MLYKEVFGLINKGWRMVLSPPVIRYSEIDKTAKVWDHCNIYNAVIGRFTYISDHTSVTHASIGAFCSISSFCNIGAASHPTNYVSTSPVFLKGNNPFRRNIGEIPFEPYKETTIGNDVWIGTHVLIKSGIHISNGAVVGMGSVVTKDIGPYEIWAGNPAKLIKKRFDDHTIKMLLETCWWDWSIEDLKNKTETMNEVLNFFSESGDFNDFTMNN